MFRTHEEGVTATMSFLANVPPFAWLGHHAVEFAVLILMLAILVSATGELIWWMWTWRRAKQIGYDKAYENKFMTTGRERRKRIDVKKGRIRSQSWPKVGAPLWVVMVVLYGYLAINFSPSTYLVLAVLWFLFAPLRTIWTIHVSRLAYNLLNPGNKLATSFGDDVHGYYSSAWGNPTKGDEEEWEPSFEDLGPISRFGNWAARKLHKYGRFWRLWRYMNPFRMWGIVVQAFCALGWFITAPIAIFWHMALVQEFVEEREWQAWWRRHRRMRYRPTVQGEVIESRDERTGSGRTAGTSGVARRSAR